MSCRVPVITGYGGATRQTGPERQPRGQRRELPAVLRRRGDAGPEPPEPPENSGSCCRKAEPRKTKDRFWAAPVSCRAEPAGDQPVGVSARTGRGQAGLGWEQPYQCVSFFPLVHTGTQLCGHEGPVLGPVPLGLPRRVVNERMCCFLGADLLGFMICFHPLRGPSEQARNVVI